MRDPLVTVYITNYNYGKYLEKAINSLLSQTFQDFEAIIIDDGSTDNSKEIIEKYSNNQKIKVIFQKNKGLNVTNNIALRVATGKYIMRLDADDFLDSNALLVMTNLLENDSDLGLVFPDYYIVDEHDNILNLEKRHKFDEDVTLLDQPAHGACTMIRKKFLQFLGGYDEQYRCQDGYELWVKFTSKYKVTNIDTPLFYYRRHGTNLTSNEKRILETRASIKENYANQNHNGNDNNIAIIPVRGTKYKASEIALMQLSGKMIIDWKVEEALKAQKVKKIIVSSPSNDIEEHIMKVYGTNSKVYFHKRDESLARLNVTLAETVHNILGLEFVKELNPQIVTILSIEYPFIKSTSIDDIINTIKIFNTDSIISVREETKTFFQHDGGGMKPILNQEKFSKLEREALYKFEGGLSAVKTAHFLKENKIISGRIGHIVLDQKSAHALQTKLDREIAEFLANQ
ncbi:MAG: glycosyltransferase [Bacteroidetes bacterium]|nr:glycosyltransferase [Bacteroidota bacterium]